ncbi:MAG: inositol monophosphatase family protein [Nanoarchaeota archaeon]
MQDLVDTALIAVKRAGKLIRSNYGHIEEIDIKENNWHDIVTNVDKESNEILLSTIREKFPEHNIISEESKQKQTSSDYTWYFDPLDGTTNFATRIPFFCVSVGLVLKKKIVLGIVYNPISKELFMAESNSGAALNGEKIKVSKNKDLKKTLVNFCHKNTTGSIKEIERLFTTFKMKARAFRQLGSGGLDLAYLASGRNDVVLRPDIVSWDVIPGIILVREAGGKVTDWKGNEWIMDSPNLLATNGTKMHQEVMSLLKI